MKGLLFIIIFVLFTALFAVLLCSMLFGYDTSKEKIKDWLKSIYDWTSIF
jgi:hypothetical protein